MPEVSESDKLNISKKKRFGLLAGMSKELAEMASSNQEVFERLKSVLVREVRGLRGDDDVEDPQQVKTKGRPKKHGSSARWSRRRAGRRLGVEDAVGKAIIRVAVVRDEGGKSSASNGKSFIVNKRSSREK